MWLRLSTTLCLHTLLRSELRVRAAAICSSLGNEVPGISCCPDQLDEPRVPRADGRAELLELEWLLNKEMFPGLSPCTGGAPQCWLAAWCTPCCWASWPWGKRLWNHSITDVPSSCLQMTPLGQAAYQGGCRRQWPLSVLPAPRSTRVRWEKDGEGYWSSTEIPHCLSSPGTAPDLA